MATLTCPYCYHKQESVDLYFVCDGQGSPGWKGCVPRKDDEREEHTGYSGLAMPTFRPERLQNGAKSAYCPGCGTLSARRACALCHTPLPVTLVQSLSPLIGMVGGTAAGKTVYLTVLNKLLREVISEPFRADVHLVGEQQAGSNSIHEWLQRYERALFTNGQLFGTTPPSPGGRRVPLVLQWRHPLERFGRPIKYQGTILSFCDAAGEDILTQERADRQRYLKAADGLIILLDAYQLPGVRSEVPLPGDNREERSLVDSVLAIVTEALRSDETNASKIIVPVAVVVAKFDVIEPLLSEGHFLRQARARVGDGYDERFGTNTHEHVRALLYDKGAGRVDRHMQAHYAKFRYFAVSSLGALPNYDEREVNKRGVQPKNVAEPLLWLMNLKGIIGQVKRG
ncbi:MAG: TRAFAC clade GTPase domain-containing protein [Pseudonocardiaceae bacterium]